MLIDDTITGFDDNRTVFKLDCFSRNLDYLFKPEEGDIVVLHGARVSAISVQLGARS